MATSDITHGFFVISYYSPPYSLILSCNTFYFI